MFHITLTLFQSYPKYLKSIAAPLKTDNFIIKVTLKLQKYCLQLLIKTKKKVNDVLEFHRLLSVLNFNKDPCCSNQFLAYAFILYPLIHQKKEGFLFCVQKGTLAGNEFILLETIFHIFALGDHLLGLLKTVFTNSIKNSAEFLRFVFFYIFH